MKKTLGVVAAATLAATPMVGALAAVGDLGPITDSLSITINDNCEFSRATAAHGAGDGAWGTADTADTLSKTIANNSTTTNLGSSTFKAVCNDTDGYKISLSTTGLTSGDDSIIFKNAEPVATASTWGIKYGDNWINTGDVITETGKTTAGTEYTFTYGVSAKSDQPAGTYTGTASYTMAKL